MTREEFFTELASLAEAPIAITGTENLKEQGWWDSTAVLGFIAFADSAFGKVLSIDALASATTANDLYALVTNA